MISRPVPLAADLTRVLVVARIPAVPGVEIAAGHVARLLAHEVVCPAHWATRRAFGRCLAVDAIVVAACWALTLPVAKAVGNVVRWAPRSAPIIAARARLG